MNRNTSRQNFLIVLLVVLITIAILTYRSISVETKDSIAQNSIKVSNNSTNSSTVIERQYRNGEYAAMGTYISPGGPEELEVNLTLEGDIVTEVQITKLATIPTSGFYQEKFGESFKQFVIGKNIENIKLDKIAGSSLTPIGFNEAIEKIKSQARNEFEN